MRSSQFFQHRPDPALILKPLHLHQFRRFIGRAARVCLQVPEYEKVLCCYVYEHGGKTLNEPEFNDSNISSIGDHHIVKMLNSEPLGCQSQSQSTTSKRPHPCIKVSTNKCTSHPIMFLFLTQSVVTREDDSETSCQRMAKLTMSGRINEIRAKPPILSYLSPLWCTHLECDRYTL